MYSCKPLILKRKLHFIQTNNIFSGGCPDSLPQSGKKVPCNFHNNSFPWRRFFLQVFCYYEGKKSPRSIDPCPCSHLLYKNVPIDADSRVRLSDQLSSDLEVLRSVILFLPEYICHGVKSIQIQEAWSGRAAVHRILLFSPGREKEGWGPLATMLQLDTAQLKLLIPQRF